jgi:hypothetical protein
MKNQQWLFILITFFCFHCRLYAQTVTICGKVQNEEKTPVDFCMIEVHAVSNNDTVFVTQATFSDSLFLLKATPANKYLLRFFEYGYDTIEKEIVYVGNDTIDVGSVVLDIKQQTLDEVVITANRPVFKVDGGRLIVKVENSSLQDMGDAGDVLSRIPGIRKINDEYTIFGKGAPAIYIDGKLVQNKEELNILKSGDIAEIVVDKNPSAMYAANIRAVILIKTINRLQDRFGLQMENRSSFYRKYSNSSTISVDWKKGILAANLSYRYGFSENIIKESSYRYIYNDPDVFYSNLDYKTNYQSCGHIVGGKIKLNLNDKNKLGFQYNGSFFPSDKELYDKTQLIEEQGQKQNRLITQNTTEHFTLHNTSLNYSYRQDENTALILIADYIWKEDRKNNFIREQSLLSGTSYDTNLFSDNQYTVYTTTINYQFNLFDGFTSISGIRYAHIGNYTENRFLKSLANEDSENNLTDQIAAGFFQTQKEYEKWKVAAGIRYEYDAMYITDLRTNIDMKHYFSNFVPNATIEYQPDHIWAFAVNYSRKISRPSFFDLNSSIFYEDSLSYVSGNKNILPTDINNISLNVSFWEKLSFDCGYTHYKNQIFQTYITDQDIPNRVWMIPVNIDKTESFDLSLSYFLNYKKWNMDCSAMTVIPRIEAPYLDGFLKINKPIWTFSLNNEWSIGKNLSLYENFSFNSAGYSDLTYLHPTNDLTIGLIGKFMNEKLILKIEGTDLLDGSNWNNWDVNYLNIRSGCRGNYDSRGVKISLTYKLNTIKSNLSVQKGNTDILNRIN